MKKLSFNESQCVKIETKEQYDEIRHLLVTTMTFDEVCEKHTMITLPVYLENCFSQLSGHTIGWISKPICSWTKKPLEVLSFEEAYK